MSRHALAGRTVLVTRAVDDAGLWVRRLRSLGAKPVVLPCLMCEPIADPATVARLRAAVAAADWLLLQSRRGAEAVAGLLEGRLPPAVRIAAIGPATARAAVLWLGRADIIGVTPTSAGLADMLLAQRHDATPTRVVIAAAEGGRRDAERALEAAGVTIERIDVYRTTPAPLADPKYDLAAEGVDVVLLASPSAVTGLLNCASPSPAARIVTIGPTTSAAARSAGLTVAAEARHPDLAGILEAMS